MKQDSIYCEACKRNTLHAKQESGGCALAFAILFCILLAIYGGTPGFILAVVVFVLAIVWGVITALSETFTDWRCQTCGKQNPARRQIG
jgi:hypothetical protein